ncbi:MAG TPA: hypothetical protein VES38_06780 [Methylotenera sp.]|nr:hypothetical protein [Methylotenera sp.]
MSNSVQTQNILTTTSGSATGNGFKCRDSGTSFDISLSGTGALTATVVIEATNGGAWHEIATTVLSGTGSDSDGFSNTGTWAMVRARTTAISGTNAAVNVYMGGSL